MGFGNRRFLWTCNGSKCAEVIVMVVVAMNVRRQQTSNWCDRHFQLPSLISLSFLDVLVFEASDISRTVCNQNASVLLFRVDCVLYLYSPSSHDPCLSFYNKRTVVALVCFGLCTSTEIQQSEVVKIGIVSGTST